MTTATATKWPHGHRNRYKSGCRCEACRGAASAYESARRAATPRRHCACGNTLSINTKGDVCYTCMMAAHAAMRPICAACGDEPAIRKNVVGPKCKRQIAALNERRVEHAKAMGHV